MKGNPQLLKWRSPFSPPYRDERFLKHFRVTDAAYRHQEGPGGTWIGDRYWEAEVQEYLQGWKLGRADHIERLGMCGEDELATFAVAREVEPGRKYHIEAGAVGRRWRGTSAADEMMRDMFDQFRARPTEGIPTEGIPILVTSEIHWHNTASQKLATRVHMEYIGAGSLAEHDAWGITLEPRPLNHGGSGQ
jgi:ribosomal protein S18 acetylase RimI-like enzyme